MPALDTRGAIWQTTETIALYCNWCIANEVPGTLLVLVLGIPRAITNWQQVSCPINYLKVMCHGLSHFPFLGCKIDAVYKEKSSAAVRFTLSTIVVNLWNASQCQLANASHSMDPGL